MNKHEQKAARLALGVQDACNLSRVVHAWGRAVSALWDVAHEQGHGTAWVNTHPVNVLFLDKLGQLVGQDPARTVMHAWDTVEEMAK